MKTILDACSLIAFFRNETGAGAVEVFLKNSTCYIHGINACEVFYDAYRSFGEKEAKTLIIEMQSLGIIIREDMDHAFWQTVGKLKASIRRISLADCCAIATAQKLNGTLITTDHHEFDPIVEMKICPILFIR